MAAFWKSKLHIFVVSYDKVKKKSDLNFTAVKMRMHYFQVMYNQCVAGARRVSHIGIQKNGVTHCLILYQMACHVSNCWGYVGML